MTFAQYFVNMKCILPYFPWPMDRQIDFEKYEATFQSDGGFGPDFQYAAMQSFHTCAWFETWLDALATGNTERANGALDIMVNFIPNYAQNIPGWPSDLTRPQAFQEIIDAAALGDPAPIQSYVSLNCGWMPEWKSAS